jgi:hypothetical protein
LSIDDGLRQIRQHVVKNGWTNTFNTWAGPGGWSSEPAKQFRVKGVPTYYIIDAQGNVAEAGHPILDKVANGVAKVLKQDLKPKD